LYEQNLYKNLSKDIRTLFYFHIPKNLICLKCELFDYSIDLTDEKQPENYSIQLYCNHQMKLLDLDNFKTKVFCSACKEKAPAEPKL